MNREKAAEGATSRPPPDELRVSPLADPRTAASGGSSGSLVGSPAAAAPTLSVVVPLWNEELNVAPLVARVLQALANQPRSLELILVDDASTDATWSHILEARRSESRLRAVRLLRHSGQSAALWAGFSASHGALIATLDGDLQNDPADLPMMLDKLDAYDLVCGVRTKRMDSAVRRASSAIARWARKRALGVDFRDTGCNLRAFKRSVLGNLFPFNGLHRFMPVLAHFAGARVLEIPVRHHPRTAGESKYGVWNRLGRGLWDLVGIAWYRRRQLANIPAMEQTEPPPSRSGEAPKEP